MFTSCCRFITRVLRSFVHSHCQSSRLTPTLSPSSPSSKEVLDSLRRLPRSGTKSFMRKHRLIGPLRAAVSSVTVRIRHRDGLHRLGVARSRVLMTGVAFSHLRRRRHRPDAAVVVRGREDLSRFGVRRRVSASRDALVQLHLVRRELTRRPRVVAPVELKHLALEPPRFARIPTERCTPPGFQP